MDPTRIEERRENRGSRGEGPDGMSRRHLLAGAAALLAGSCAPEGPKGPMSDERSLGTAKSALTLPTPEQFGAWNLELREKAPGRDVTVLNLDAVDHNVGVVKGLLGPGIALRIVTKSLPSLELIAYLMEKAGTRRLMAFSEGMLRALIDRFGSRVDILLGRPAPVEAAQRAFADGRSATRNVRWLVDTKERLLEYKELADTLPHPLRIAVEIDVGMRRGGPRTVTELLEMLEILANHPGQLRFVGFMGYDGHVPFAPPGFDSDTEFAAVHDRYSTFVLAGMDAYPELFEGSPVFDSGGSMTFHRYGADLMSPVNEIAMGSGFLLPAHFADLSSTGLLPAVFQASPVLKRVDPAEVPFAEGYLPYLAQTDPNLEISFHMVGGGFPGDVVFPEGLIVNPFMPESDGVKNLMTNQTMRNGSSDVPLGRGDFIFYHPWEGGALVWLSSMEVLKSDEITERWATFQEGCLKGCGVPQ